MEAKPSKNNTAKSLKAVWLIVWKPQFITVLPLGLILVFLCGSDRTHSLNKLNT